MPQKWTRVKRHPGIYSYENESGKFFGVRTRYVTLDGHRREWSRSGFKNWREADIELKKFQVKLSDGTISTAETKQVTLNSYFYQMRDRKVKMKIWRPSTDKGNVNYYKQWFQKRFGDQNINDISRQKYQRFIDSLVADYKLAKSTIHRIDSLMQQIMNDAEANDVIYKNKLRHIVVSGGKPPKDQSLDQQDYAKFMRTAKEIYDRYRFAMIYFLALGERRGELLGLRKSSFNFKMDEVHKQEMCEITFNLARTPDSPKGGPLKNDSSYRSVWVNGEFVQLIHYVLNYSDMILENLGQDSTADHFIWLNPETGQPFHPSTVNEYMQRVAKKSGVKIHPHQLRHYFATKALSDKLPDMDIVHWLGHKSLQMTDSYSRPTQEGSLKIYRGISKDI